MPEILVATPLPSITRAYDFDDGISIREISPILWDVSVIEGFISKREMEDLAQTRYWLCASGEQDYRYPNQGSELLGKVEYAMSALQIIYPSGAKNTFLRLHQTDNGYENMGASRPRELLNTFLGRITNLEEQGLARDFAAVYNGVKSAFTTKLVRLQNPILLLEHAQQTGNVHLSMLMCVMGLDMLFMAGKKSSFIEQLGGFLGGENRVFPFLGEQPRVLVRDVIADLYQFRNIVAHGQEVPERPYRQKYDLLDDAGNPINVDDFYYAELMLESSIFMLTGALRKVFVDGLLDAY